MSACLRDVVVTGIGVVSPLGHSPADVVDRVLEGTTAIAPISGFDTKAFPTSLGAAVTGFKARDWVSNRKQLKTMAPAVRFGMGAVRKAADAAGLEKGAGRPERFGMFVGAGTAFGDSAGLAAGIARGLVSNGAATGQSDPSHFDTVRFATNGMPLIHPLWLLKGLSNNVLGYASAALDAQGINQNYCNSGSGGLQAIGEAAWALAENRADTILAGGADSAVNPEHMTGFGRLGLLTGAAKPSDVCPFDRRADGFAPGEGAAFFALERGETARRRGATAIARIAGYGDGTSTDTLAGLDASVVARSLARALAVAEWAPSDIDSIWAHGNGNPTADRAEADAIRSIFGDVTPAVTGDKALQGHAIAAAGPIALAVAIESARRGRIPALAHIESPASICDRLDLVRVSRERATRRILVHAAGLGGQSTWLAVEIL